MQHIIFPLAEPHKVPLCLFLHSGAVALNGSMAISSARHSSQCHIICKLAVHALCPITQVNCTAPGSTSGPPMTGLQLVFMSMMTILWAQSFSCISVHLTSTCLASISSACLQGCYGDSVHCSSLIHPAVISLYKSYQVS